MYFEFRKKTTNPNPRPIRGPFTPRAAPLAFLQANRRRSLTPSSILSLLSSLSHPFSSLSLLSPARAARRNQPTRPRARPRLRPAPLRTPPPTTPAPRQEPRKPRRAPTERASVPSTHDPMRRARRPRHPRLEDPACPFLLCDNGSSQHSFLPPPLLPPSIDGP
jgi:hypothetical protein